ncbi:MAG: U32 family peptidase [Planctomycetes bacterium]|nr:U32 family peptidase [Planctomycetota bacterium]
MPPTQDPVENQPNIELLAPAGCYPSLHAAIENGADAVYFGLAQLNMRARARRSFGPNDLAEICRITRDAGVKTNMALNTLLYEHDLRLCRSMLEEAAENKVDAVILSDMAAVTMANEMGLDVHLSTQLSISNSESIRFYAPYCSRIVLARELSLKMIETVHQQIQAQAIRGKSGKLIELEAFAHGALCIAVSGRCSMSLYTSNASANRGACEQNCRKEYIVKDVDSGQELLIDNNLVMSPNDILTIGFLDQMVNAGIQVFKIEGRGRAPEYVAAVTSAYRRALDAIKDGSFTREYAESMIPDLEKVYNRGFSSGYYLGQKQGWSQHSGNKATRRKEMVGRIANFFQKASVVHVKSSAVDFSVDDEYVIIGTSTGAENGVVGDLFQIDGEVSNKVTTVKKGNGFTLKHDGAARRGDYLYRMTPVAAKV